MLNETFDYSKMCSQGQIKGHYYRKVFPSINLTFTGKLEDSNVSEEDVLTGFKTFSAIIYCSEPVALSKFLNVLPSTQSPRTIIRATVNTIQSDDIN